MWELLAQNNFGDTRGPALAGPLGLFLILCIAVVTIFLIRNMNSRLRQLPKSFGNQSEQSKSFADTGAQGKDVKTDKS